MKKQLILLTLTAAVLALLALDVASIRAHKVAASSHPNSSHSAPITASSAQDTSSNDDGDASLKVIRFASNPEPMPPFLVNDLDGNILSTAELRGKVVILNFFATWCEPCREEIPEMIELSNRYKDRVQVVAVSQDDDATPQEVRDFARNQHINYPIVMGNTGISSEYGGVPALPTAYLVNRDGRVVQKHVGLYSTAVYDQEIRALLGEHVGASIETFVDEGQIFLKNAANATELPGVSFKGLTADQKRVALKQMNSVKCTCGCNMTIAQCRINDESCPTSKELAAKIVRQAGSAPSPAATANR